MKTAISLPDPLFSAAESLAQSRGWTRSHLYAAALSEYVEKHQQADITARLNAIYETEDSSLDPLVVAMQDASIPREDW